MKRNKLITILFLFVNLPLVSQWSNYTSESSSLPDNHIYSLALDSKNNIWMSTYEGIAKFDGYENWTIYDTLTSEIPTNNTCAIAIDKDNILWSSSNGGNSAFRFDGVTWELFKTEDFGVSHFCASDIEFDFLNRPWYATSRFVKYQDNDKWIEVPHAPDVAGFSDVNSVEEDMNNEIWLATETEGVLNISNAKLTKYKTDNSEIPTNRIASLAVDSLNNLWIGTKDSRIIKFNKQNNEWTIFDIVKSTLERRIAQIRVDEKGDVWATSGLRLLHFDGSNWDTLHLDADTSGGAGPYVINDFLFNKFGNIYAITDINDGLYKYTRNPETSVDYDHSDLINIFPNPVKDNLSLEIDASILVSKYQIVDMEGRTLIEESSLGSNPQLINLKPLVSGTYFIELFTNDGIIIKEKIIKE